MQDFPPAPNHCDTRFLHILLIATPAMPFATRSLLLLPGLLAGVLHAAPVPAPADSPAVTEAPAAPFSQSTLYSLLKAEFAIGRNQATLALPEYQAQATSTRDAGVIERALQVANYLQDSPVALSLAALQAEVSPKLPAAHYQIAYHALKQQHYEEAIQAIDRLLDLDPEAELEALFISAYPANPEDREKLLNALSALEKSRPDNPHLLFAHALMISENGDAFSALEYIRRAQQKNGGSVPITLLHARLLTQTKQELAALDLLEKAAQSRPRSRQINLSYAKLLIRQKKHDLAENKLQQLLQYYPDDGEILLLHALLAFDSHHDTAASSSLQKLLLQDEHANEAHYYLGMIARRQKQPAVAEQHLSAIEDGPHFIAARSELANLLESENRLKDAQQSLASARQQHPEEAPTLYVVEAELLDRAGHTADAFNLLQEGCQRFPQENLVLFSRALMADKLKNMSQFEQDMQQLLVRDPHNPTYLNTLGYTLADKTHRYGEAENYLRQAYQLRPDDPAIIDSMGWLFYRQGNLQDALDYIQRAYSLYVDDEIGLHLAELLWVSGRKTDAQKVWQQLLSRNPKSELILKHKAQWEQKT